MTDSVRKSQGAVSMKDGSAQVQAEYGIIKENKKGHHNNNGSEKAQGKEPYTRPKLICHGKVTDLTLGGSPLVEESGICGVPGFGNGITPCP